MGGFKENKRPEVIYIYGSSAKDLYEENEPDTFRINLGTTLDLEGKWEMALMDIDLPRLTTNYKPQYITLYSSVCTSSIIGAAQRPILYRFFKSDLRYTKALNITTPRYVPLNTDSLPVIDIYLLDDKGEKPSFQKGQTTCTLHLRKI